MQLHCRYHPTRVPVLICSQCATTVCPDCVPSWPDRGNPRCITCRAEMEPLGISEYVKPFWQCFDRFFKFPLKAGNVKFLLLMLIISLLIPMPGGDVEVAAAGFIFRIIGWILFPSFIVAYLSAVGIKGSDGNSEPPEVSEAWSEGGLSLFFKALVIMIIFSAAVGLASAFLGKGIAFAITLFGALALPASLMLLFLEREIASAVSVGRILGVIQAIGLPYLFLWGLVTMLTSGPDIAMSLPDNIIESDIFPRIFLLVNIYFGLVLFHLLGYVAYQYHYELGISLPGEQIEELHKPNNVQKALLLESEILIMDGKYNSAILLLQKFLQQHPDNEQVWLHLFNLAKAVLEKEEMMDISCGYFDHLIKKNQGFKLVATLRQLMQKFPQIKLHDFDNSTSLRTFLEKEKEHQLLELLS